MSASQILRIARLAAEGHDAATIASRVGFGMRTVTAVLDQLRELLAAQPAPAKEAA